MGENRESDLFARVIELQRLVRFDGYADGRALLARQIRITPRLKALKRMRHRGIDR